MERKIQNGDRYISEDYEKGIQIIATIGDFYLYRQINDTIVFARTEEEIKSIIESKKLPLKLQN